MLKPHPHLGSVLDELMAVIDPDSREVVAMLYSIDNVGTFVRRDEAWRFPSRDEKRALAETQVVEIQRSSAKDMVKLFDASIRSNKLLTEDDLDPYREKDLI